MTTENSVPRLIAEWESQDAIMLVWPHASSDWAGNLQQAETAYEHISRAILEQEALIIVVRDHQQQEHVSGLLSGVSRNLYFYMAKTNDTWIRDYGPLAIDISGTNSLVDFRFNAWGGKYPSELDDALCAAMKHSNLFPSISTSSLVLEGGAVETNGTGTLLATRSSVISEARNPGLEQEVLEKRLNETLGISHFLWIECAGIEGDDTDGHIDTLARFVDTHTIVYATVQANHPDAQTLDSLARQLGKLTDDDGEPYRLIPLPPPPLRYSTIDGRLLAATYANFLMINDAVLLPVYGDSNDTLACQILERTTGRKVIPIDCNALIEQNGSLHCATMQLPRGTVEFGNICT